MEASSANRPPEVLEFFFSERSRGSLHQDQGVPTEFRVVTMAWKGWPGAAWGTWCRAMPCLASLGNVQLRLTLNSSSGSALGCSATLLKNQYLHKSWPACFAATVVFLLTLLPPYSLLPPPKSHRTTYTHTYPSAVSCLHTVCLSFAIQSCFVGALLPAPQTHAIGRISSIPALLLSGLPPRYHSCNLLILCSDPPTGRRLRAATASSATRGTFNFSAEQPTSGCI
jgi:hypothetical protein